MQVEGEPRRVWAWNLSALVYTWSYIKLAHQIDSDFLTYLEKRLVGAIVADCGCGPGIVAAKLLVAGASLVVAIDVNAEMIKTGENAVGQTDHLWTGHSGAGGHGKRCFGTDLYAPTWWQKIYHDFVQT